jgi:pyrroloquinoline-quinone synthase
MNFRESLLKTMDRKDHWAWSHFSGPKASLDQLLIHFQQEYLTYVRDFPRFLGRIHGMCPDLEARRLIAENLYEEETGGLSRTGPHPELFLRMMEGLGFPRRRFEKARLLPASARYRRWLDRASAGSPWIVGAAVITIFVEGSVHERSHLETGRTGGRPARFNPRADMLVRYHGLQPAFLTLKRAHSKVENQHREAAWKIVESRARSASVRRALLEAMDRSLELWHAYRDGVARAAGLVPFRSVN